MQEPDKPQTTRSELITAKALSTAALLLIVWLAEKPSQGDEQPSSDTGDTSQTTKTKT